MAGQRAVVRLVEPAVPQADLPMPTTRAELREFCARLEACFRESLGIEAPRAALRLVDTA